MREETKCLTDFWRRQKNVPKKTSSNPAHF